MKLCKRCEKSGKFLKDKRTADGLQRVCTLCANTRRKEAYKLNPEKYRQAQKKYAKDSLKRMTKHIRDISDTYVIAELKRGTNLNTFDFLKFPELIETKRQLIKNKRLCKISKN
jgi:hypothetical protein